MINMFLFLFWSFLLRKWKYLYFWAPIYNMTNRTQICKLFNPCVTHCAKKCVSNFFEAILKDSKFRPRVKNITPPFWSHRFHGKLYPEKILSQILKMTIFPSLKFLSDDFFIFSFYDGVAALPVLVPFPFSATVQFYTYVKNSLLINKMSFLTRFCLKFLI